jgi:hypothetical protein
VSSAKPTSTEADRDRLDEGFVASTDVEFDLLAEFEQATGERAAELQTKLDAQAARSRRLWARYSAGESDD